MGFLYITLLCTGTPTCRGGSAMAIAVTESTAEYGTSFSVGQALYALIGALDPGPSTQLCCTNYVNHSAVQYPT